MTVRAYPVYKESGIEWIGDIPEQWQHLPLKRAIQFTTGWTPPTGRDDLYGGDYPWVTIGDMKGREITAAAKGVTLEAVQLGRGEVSPAGSLLFSFKLSIGQVAFAGVDVYTNEAIATFLPSNKLSLNYAYYVLPLFVSANAVENIYSAKLLNQDLINNADLILPSLDEQSFISAFLDRETGKIDALVAEQERLIALLKEKRQAVISHVVTKGLNPNAPMRDSGVPWLGEVPKHWLVGRCSYYFNVFPGFAFASGSFSQDDADTRLLRGTNVGVSATRWDDVVYWRRTPNDNLDDYELSEGDLVLGMDRPWISTGVRVAKLTAADVPSLLLQRVARISALGQVSTDILEIMLSSEFFISHFGPEMTGVSIPHISPDQIGDFKIPVPPESEQVGIIRYANEIRQQSDRLMTEAAHAITLLRERRTALISAAVTGKIDVRNAVLAVQDAA